MYKFKHLLSNDAIFRYKGNKYHFQNGYFTTNDEALAQYLNELDFIILLEKPNDVDDTKGKHSSSKGK